MKVLLIAKHSRTGGAAIASSRLLEALKARQVDVKMLVQEGERLPMLNAVVIPEGADDLKVRKALLNDLGMEIGGGLGALAGKIWRVGLMGHSSCQRNVFLFLSGLETILKSQGVKVREGALEAASSVYAGE